MNICYLCRTFQQGRGGAEAYYGRMANALSARGHTIHIVTQKGEEKSYLNELDRSIHVHTIDFNEEPFKGYWLIEKYIPLSGFRYALSAARKIKEIQNIYPIDVIESPDWTAEGFFLSIFKKIPLCVRLHGLPEYFPLPHIKSNLRTRLKKAMIKFTIFNASSVASVSNNFTQLIKKAMGYNKPVDVIYSGIDQTIYKPDNAIKRERSVLFVGRLEEGKGIAIIAQAIPQVLKDFPDIKFIFAGNATRYKNTQETWADHVKHSVKIESLTFLGQVSTSEVVSCYQKSLISIFPSLYEPGGTVALEAMACGCATIATNLGGFAEFIEDGVDGLLIPPNDPESLANAIRKLLEDDALREEISVNALQKVTEKFNLNKTLDEALEEYKKAINYATS